MCHPTYLCHPVGAHYPTTFKIIISMMSMTFVLLGLFRFYVLQINRKRDEIKRVEKTDANQTAFMDMTDEANPNFR